MKTLFDTGDTSGTFTKTLRLASGFDTSKKVEGEGGDGEEEAEDNKDKCCHANSSNDVMTLGLEGDFELTDGINANVKVGTE